MKLVKSFTAGAAIAARRFVKFSADNTVVQAAAATAWDSGASFRESVSGDVSVRGRLDDATLAELFDPKRALRNLDVVFDRLAKIDVTTNAVTDGGGSGT